jgi:hypothetical protein
MRVYSARPNHSERGTSARLGVVSSVGLTDQVERASKRYPTGRANRLPLTSLAIRLSKSFESRLSQRVCGRLQAEAPVLRLPCLCICRRQFDRLLSLLGDDNSPEVACLCRTNQLLNNG